MIYALVTAVCVAGGVLLGPHLNVTEAFSNLVFWLLGPLLLALVGALYICATYLARMEKKYTEEVLTLNLRLGHRLSGWAALLAVWLMAVSQGILAGRSAELAVPQNGVPFFFSLLLGGMLCYTAFALSHKLKRLIANQ